MINVSIFDKTKTNYIVEYETYGQVEAQPDEQVVIQEEETIPTTESLVLTSTDIFGDLEKANQKRAQQTPSTTQISRFLSKFDVPIPILVAMFGGYGRVLLKASLVYAAMILKDNLIIASRGNQKIIEVALKLYIAYQMISDLQYLAAQPVVTPTGPGVVTPI